MYKTLRNVLFLLPAETAHYFSMNFLKIVCAVPFIRKGLRKFFTYHASQTLDAHAIIFIANNISIRPSGQSWQVIHLQFAMEFHHA